MKYRISVQDVEALERALNRSGSPRVEVAIENGKVVLLQVDKKKIN